MSANNIFIFKNIYSTKVGVWLMYLGAIALGTIILSAVIRPPFLYVAILLIVNIIIGQIIFKALFRKSTLTFILNERDIEISINQKIIQTILLSDFISIRTLDPSNLKNASTQFEVLSRDMKMGFFRMIAKDEQKMMSFLCNALVSKYNFAVKDIPFSIWTHNLSNVKYIEYVNPMLEKK